MSNCSDWVIELNSFARGVRVDRWPGTITAETTPSDLIEISRRYLLSYWKEDEGGRLAPACAAAEQIPIPDEVVVRAPDGRALYRRTIIDEKIDRLFAENWGLGSP
jgi:hypothetical protein